MKNSFALFIAVASVATAVEIKAQVPVTFDQPLVNQLNAESSAPKSSSWWNLLGRQLTFSLDQGLAQGYEAIKVEHLQNLLFTAYNYGDQVDLSDAVPVLLEIYQYHETEAIRIMAVAALDAIGDQEALKSLKSMVDQEPSERLRRIMSVAIKNLK